VPNFKLRGEEEKKEKGRREDVLATLYMIPPLCDAAARGKGREKGTSNRRLKKGRREKKGEGKNRTLHFRFLLWPREDRKEEKRGR